MKNPRSHFFKSNKSWLVMYSGLLLITLAGYWQVTTGMFAVKNDDIIYFLPYRYNIVENLRNGFFPLWSPYVFMGFPIAGDMQSGAWNPVVWLLSLTGRYTLTTLHAELLIYLYLSGVGMFLLMQELNYKQPVCWLTAVSYMFCGFMIDSGQILCWVCCAAFLPFVYLCFRQILKRPGVPAAIAFSLAGYMLLVGGYPFFFIANLYAFFLVVVFYMVRSYQRKTLSDAVTSVRYLAFAGLVLVLISAAPVLSFYELLPFYSRGSGLSLADALHNSYSLFSSLSVLLPFATTKAHAYFNEQENISRNIYFGILLLPFAAKGVFQNRTFYSNVIALLCLIALFLSLGNTLPFRSWAYWHLPLMDTFRHPANFRIFLIFGLLMLSAKGLNSFLAAPTPVATKTMIKMYVLLGLLVIILCLFFLRKGWSTKQFGLNSEADWKSVFLTLDFNGAVLVVTLLQVPFIAGAIYCLNTNQLKALCVLAVSNVIIVMQPQVFYSMVSKRPITEINRFIHKQPAGFPLPDLEKPIFIPDEPTRYKYGSNYIGYHFLKQVTLNQSINNPTIFKSYGKFIHDSLLILTMRNHPFAYFADSSFNSEDRDNPVRWIKKDFNNAAREAGAKLVIQSFSPEAMSFFVSGKKVNRLAILQNNYPGWSAMLDKAPLHIQTINHSFMGVVVSPGNHLVTLTYKPWWFLPGMLTSGISLFACFAYLASHLYKRRQISIRRDQ